MSSSIKVDWILYLARYFCRIRFDNEYIFFMFIRGLHVRQCTDLDGADHVAELYV